MRGAVRVLWMQAAPGNLFGPPLCAALMAGLQAAMADRQTTAVVLASALRGPGQGFSGGMDLADLGRDWPEQNTTPATIARLLLEADLPVIAALHGPALGAGAEIALAARARVAAPDLRFGLRDVLIGRLPMAGATQTLPRLIGAVQALRLLGQGGSLPAADALAMGIVDVVTEGDLLAAALAMAAAPPPAGRAPGLRDGRGYQAGIAQARADGVMPELVNCIEAAQLLPLAQGLDYEAEAASEVAARPEAAALRHLMMAEMRMVVDLAGGKAVQRLGLWGAACWPLVLPALRAGIEVVLADDDREALVKAVERLALTQEEQVAAGQLGAAARDQEWARLRPAVALDALVGLPLVVAGKPGPQGRVLYLGGHDDLGPDAARLHLVAPGVAELQVGQGPRNAWQTAAATLRQMRIRLAVTQAVPAQGCGRALVGAAQQACLWLIGQGASREAVAQALAGVMRMPLPKGEGDGRSAMAAAAMKDRVLGAVAAEAARLLEQGAVRRAGVLDALAVVGLGMPRHAGGPLFAADQRGLLLLRRDLMQWQNDHPVWAPSALLDRLVSQGARLSDAEPDAAP
jgi:3-hydroxyacyl-CoA dehydrogenase